MAAPSIPNLLSLRGGTNRRGRGRPGGRGGASAPQSSKTHDTTIQGTDTDAAVSRLSAVSLGYIEDQFAQHFVPASADPPTKRLPIINRGTYTRTAGLDHLITSFLAGPGRRQIVSLGAGTDTRALRLIYSGPPSAAVTYHEIDFPAIASRKLGIVQATPQLGTHVLPGAAKHRDSESWYSQARASFKYWCHGMDLRCLARDQAVDMPGLERDVPTLLVSECCLCYLEPQDARALVKWFAEQIPNLALVLYEPIRPGDAFGKMMVSNLAARQIRMPTLDEYRDAADQEARLKEAGFDHVRHMTVDAVWNDWIPQEEKERLDDLEGLDEVEEWKLLASHYIVAWGWRGRGFDSWSA